MENISEQELIDKLTMVNEDLHRVKTLLNMNTRALQQILIRSDRNTEEATAVIGAAFAGSIAFERHVDKMLEELTLSKKEDL